MSRIEKGAFESFRILFKSLRMDQIVPKGYLFPSFKYKIAHILTNDVGIMTSQQIGRYRVRLHLVSVLYPSVEGSLGPNVFLRITTLHSFSELLV